MWRGLCLCTSRYCRFFGLWGRLSFARIDFLKFFFLTAMTSKGRKEWKKMKVQELRDELSRRGLDVGGLRPALIERLEKSSNPPGNAGDEPGGPGLTEIPPPSEDGREITSAGNGEVPLAKVDEPEIAVNAEKAGGSKDTVSMNEPAVPVTAVEKPSSGGKDDGVANACGPLSDLEKKHRRAERFGLALHLSEEEKRKSRAARFGESPNGTPKANYPGGELKTSEEERRKARAERFGLSPRSYADDEAKKKARLARFGIDVKSDSLEEDKRKARATRFASVLDSRTSEVNKKIKPELAGTVAST